ncbi:MAG: ABC transporter permease [Gordonia sp. (in: high G+C Gram-positive bacteria)]
MTTAAFEFDTGKKFRRRPLAVRAVHTLVHSPTLPLAWFVVLVAVAAAIAPHVFTSSDPLGSNPGDAFLPPSWTHLFGTDQLGRDMFARIVYGARNTLQATVYAVLIAFVGGGVIGLVSGYIGRGVDAVVMRVIDVLLSVPSLLLCMTIVVALGYGTMNVALAVGIAAIASFARVMRAEVIRVVGSQYTEATRGLGARWPRILFLHVLPNSISSLASLAALEFGTAVLAIAGLGFLGYGAPPPTPEWGLEVSEGRNFLATYPWLAIIPGAVIAVVVIATNRISTSLKDSNR